jgi:hypothetical protein
LATSKYQQKGFLFLLKAQCRQNFKYIAADIQAKNSVQTVFKLCFTSMLKAVQSSPMQDIVRVLTGFIPVPVPVPVPVPTGIEIPLDTV